MTTFLRTLIVGWLVLQPALAADPLVVYSLRQSALMTPIVEAYEKNTGTAVDLIYFKNGVIERLALERHQPRADLLLTSDTATLLEAERQGLLTGYDSSAVERSVPASYRHDNNAWVAVTQRARIFYVNKNATGAYPDSYEALASPEFRGQLCVRPLLHPYNIGLISALYGHWGENKTRQWLQGIKANLAQPPSGNDREQVRLVHAGACTVSVGNSYYYGLMLNNPKQKPWAQSVKLVFPRIDNNQAGTHVNVSGIGMIRTEHPQAIDLVEFLVSKPIQEMYAAILNEYPVNPQAKLSRLVQSFGQLKPDPRSIVEAHQYRREAVDLVAEAGF